jgi:hypothetical protein
MRKRRKLCSKGACIGNDDGLSRYQDNVPFVQEHDPNSCSSEDQIYNACRTV